MHISQDMAWDMMQSLKGYMIIDVRGNAEFRRGHLPGARNIPIETLMNRPISKTTNRHMVIFVYCQNGGRAKRAAEYLEQLGFTNVYELGGIDGWTGAVVK